MKNKQLGSGGGEAIILIIIAIIILGSLKECSIDEFERDCRKLGGIPAGNSCVKPGQVIKERYQR